MPRFKKGSVEAKRYMASIRKKKATTKKAVAKKVTKKAVAKKPIKKAVSKSTHKDTKSHNVNIRVVSGIDINQASLDELARLIKINKSHTAYIKHLKDAPDRDPNLLKIQVARVKEAIASNKKRITDLKKLIK